MKKVQLVPVFIFLILSQVSFGQTGHPHIVNFDINENYTGSKIKSITFDQKYNVYVAGRKGVALFNGNYWRSVNDSPSNVNYILADSSGQKIYTAAKNDFGFIRPDSTLTYHYKSLKKPNDSGQNFSKIILTPAKVIFYSQSDIYIISLSDDSDRIHLSSNETGDFAGLFALKDQIYINIVGKGMHKLNGSTPEPMSAGKQFQNSKILFSAPYNKYSLLLGTNENKIYIFTGRRFKLFTTKTDIGKFLKENILWNGARFSKNQFVLTTLTGGAVFVDRIYGKIQQTVNYQTGLPDDEITAFAVDKNNGLWLAHQHGLSRCNINSVVKNYSSYPGVYGNLNDIINFKDSLYVASNEGVYKLSKIKNYREKQILIKKKAKYGYKFTPKLTYILQSVDYKFIPAEGLSDKCKMLYNLNDSTLLAFSDYGIFSITDTTANQLIEDIYINDFCTDADTSSLYVATLKGVSQINYHTDTATNRAVWSKQSLYESPRPIYSVTQNSDKSLFFGSDGKAYYMQPDTSGNYSDPTEIKFPKKINEPVQVKYLTGKICFLQSSGIYIFDEDKQHIIAPSQSSPKFEQYLTNYPDIWTKVNQWQPADTSRRYKNSEYLNLFNKIRTIYSDQTKNIWLINQSQELYKISQDTTLTDSVNFQVYITSVTDKKDSLYIPEHPRFSFDRNAVRIKLSAPCYLSNQGTQYRYKIQGLDNYEDWSPWSENPIIELSFIPSGNYKLVVNAKNILGDISDEKTMKLSVEIPFTETEMFYFIVSLSGLALFLLIFFAGRYRLKLKNKKLEAIITERTKEITEKNTELQTQKEEIETQRDTLAGQKDEIESQRDSLSEKNVEIEKQNKHITDSISYAKNIQQAILPTQLQIKNLLPDNFIYYRPKDIVSGDFYWFAERKDSVYFAAADCTGHGVPGAFMSMLGVSLLNNIVNSSRKKELMPSDILSQLTEQIIESLHQTGDPDEAKDGMDISLCKIDRKTNKAVFAGAFNPLYLVWNDEIRVIEPNRRPVGIYEFQDKVKPFKDEAFDVRKGDMLYSFSDGYVDQFGGKRGRKFNIGNFKKLLLKIHKLPLEEQQKKIHETMHLWMKDEPSQIDDMLIVGVRI